MRSCVWCGVVWRGVLTRMRVSIVWIVIWSTSEHVRVRVKRQRHSVYGYRRSVLQSWRTEHNCWRLYGKEEHSTMHATATLVHTVFALHSHPPPSLFMVFPSPVLCCSSIYRYFHRAFTLHLFSLVKY